MATQTNYNNKVEIRQWNTKNLFCAVYDSSDNLMNLNGYTADLYAKNKDTEYQGDVDIHVSGTLIDASNGAILFSFTEADTSVNTGNYDYEVIVDNSVNKISVIYDRLQITNSLKQG